MWSPICARSGSHLERRSGRGLPYRSFRPSVMTKAPVSAMPRPSSPVLISQSLRRHIRAFGVEREAVGPGTRSRQTRRMVRIGATMETRRRVRVEIVSGV
jgi:hypothetical protein